LVLGFDMRHWQFIVAMLWGGLGLVAVLRQKLFSDEQLNALPIRDWSMAIVISILMTTWNLARWWQHNNRPHATRLPLQSSGERGNGYEYNPDLDFLKSPPTRSDAANNDPPTANPNTNSPS
jgi:hypothetical protein